jgi:hypothetical protein
MANFKLGRMVMLLYGTGITISLSWEITSKYTMPKENSVIHYVLRIHDAPILHTTKVLVS